MSIVFIDNTNEGIADLAEILLSRFGFVDGDREGNLLILRWNFRQIHLDLLVIAFALTRPVITEMFYRAGLVPEVVLEHEVRVSHHFSALVKQKGRCIQVEGLTA